MTLFQILAAPLAVFLFLRSFFKLTRGGHPRTSALLGAIIWLAAALTILNPDLTILLARMMGVGRGADLVLYILALSFFLAVFYFYSRILKLESNLSEIVRRLAVSDALRRWPQDPLAGEEAGTRAGNEAAPGEPEKKA